MLVQQIIQHTKYLNKFGLSEEEEYNIYIDIYI
jgi:hypothetical protein